MKKYATLYDYIADTLGTDQKIQAFLKYVSFKKEMFKNCFDICGTTSWVFLQPV